VRDRDLDTLEFPRVLDAVAALARSTAGHETVLALRPTTDLDEAEHRLDLCAEVLAASATSPLPATAVPLLSPALAGAAPDGSALETRRLVEVRDVLGAARRMRSWLDREPERFPKLAALSATLPELAGLERALARTLDETGRVRADASPELTAARAATRELRDILEQRLERVVRDQTNAAVIAEDYVTVRNGRYVVPIRASMLHAFRGIVQDRSGSDETVFVEPLFAVDLNNRLMLAAGTEEVEERRVRAELTDQVRAHTAELAQIERGLAAVDALGAAAAFATQLECTRPALGADEVRLEQARHPLLLATGRPVVPIDVRIPAGGQGLAITGPNAGGKTVALKTLGLSTLMAQAGLFVPAAAGSRLPLRSAVLADIGDEQSIERDLSTFTAHAENLAAIARAAGPQALVLLDEPGAGTDPVEGAALAVGVLTDLLERGPIVAFTTHFPQVKAFALAEPRLEVAACEVDAASGAPRFRLAYHTVGQSFALPIARRHGVPGRALEVAERLLAGESQDLARAVARLEESRQRFDAGRAAADAEAANLAATRQEVEALGADLRARQRQRWSTDLEASRRFLRDLQSEGRALLDELRQRPDPATLRTFVKDAAAAVTRHAADAAEPAAPPSRAPKPGDMVEVVGRGISGELLEIAGPRARILRGGLRFEVAADQLRVVSGGRPREVVTVAVARPEVAEERIDLVGLRAREAIEALQGFLDRAVRSGASEVRIVHGVGTGALKRAVHDFLGSSGYCTEYHEAEPQAGGAGVTVAVLT